jgi:hypothetical protein
VGSLLSIVMRQSSPRERRYRRLESSGVAGRLYDRLIARLGDDQVFMDVDKIRLGVDFTQVIAQAVSECAVLLVVIGPRWLTATDQDGRRRLDDPNDVVRLEIQMALERGVLVIPVLVEGAVMPRRDDLPESLAGLARRNALLIRHESFGYDTDRLLKAIESILPSADDQGRIRPSAVRRGPGRIRLHAVRRGPGRIRLHAGGVGPGS